MLKEKHLQPNPSLIFRPMIMTPPDRVRVVFVAAEPYPYYMGQHDGFAYSAPDYIKYDKDVGDIYPTLLQGRFMKELVRDTGIVQPRHCSLLKWARQGVFLWNYTPTVRRGAAQSHLHWGWDELSREVLEIIAIQNPKAIFVPWGMPKFGRNSIEEIVLPTSPIYDGKGPEFVDERGWYGSSPFTKINKMLGNMKEKPINWAINY